MLRAVPIATILLWLAASAQTPVWTHTWNGPGTSGEAAYSGCRDSSGNIYICGSNEYEMLVVAVRPDGSELWTWRYEPPAGAEAEASDITCGADGNLYVCGSVGYDEDPSDFCVVSLTPTGAERWRHDWNDPGTYYLNANRIIWGGDGNIYACGMVENDNTYQDAFVISLTPAGAERWTFVYDGGFADMDQARDIIWGPDSNLHVCGVVTPSDTGYLDFGVFSLTPLGGLRWLHAYSPPAGGYDAACRLVSDGRNLFAAGVSQSVIYEPRVCVVSLTPAGTRRWVYERQASSGCDQATDIIIGANGRLFVSGSVSDGSGLSDAVVLGLDSLGREEWDWTWGSSAGSDEVAMSLVLAGDGNIAVAGCTYSGLGQRDMLAASLTQSGSERWARTINGPADSYDGADDVLAGPAGAALVVGEITDSLTSSDFAVLRLSASGGTEWTYTWDSGRRNGSDGACRVALAPDGTAYVVGSGYWGSTYNELAVVAISPNGQEDWNYHYSLPRGMGSAGWSVAVGSDANIYVCGSGTDSAGSGRFLSLSLTPSGAERWTADVGSGTGIAACTGPDNSVYACGELLRQNVSWDFAVAALTAAGAPRWTYNYDGGIDDGDCGYAVCCGPDSNVYACGYSTTADRRSVFTVLSLTPAGSQRWVWADSVPENASSSGYAITSGTDGNVYVCGSFADAANWWLVAASFTPAGALRWRYQSPMFGWGRALACGPDSTIYVAGALYCDSTYWDMAVVALRPNGETLWVRTVPETGWYEEAASVAVGDDSLIYLAGRTEDDEGEQFFTVVCFSHGGRPLWTWRTRGDVPGGENEAACVATRQDGSAVVTGSVCGPGTGSDIFTALFTPGVGIAGPAAKPGPDRFHVPSHFRSSLVCRLPRLAGPTRLLLIDAAGRVVARGEAAPGARDYVFPPALTARLAAGAYFVRLVTPQSTRVLRTVRVE